MANHSGRNVVRSAETGKRIAVKELTTGLIFASLNLAAKHFGITPTVIKQYANNRVKFPQLPYRFEWIK
jgi:hypothetical protein